MKVKLYISGFSSVKYKYSPLNSLSPNFCRSFFYKISVFCLQNFCKCLLVLNVTGNFILIDSDMISSNFMQIACLISKLRIKMCLSPRFWRARYMKDHAGKREKRILVRETYAGPDLSLTRCKNLFRVGIIIPLKE